MSAPIKRLCVFGGSGFLGSRICKIASTQGWSVTSISRSGQPHWQSLFNTPTAPDWAANIAWEKGNILSPASYRTHLSSATAVVHSMGILLEADYKGVLTGKEPLVSGLKNAFSPMKATNPIDKDTDDLEGKQLSYETMNRDSAVLLARECAAAGVGAFLYVSAADGFPLLPSRYISTKREAELETEKIGQAAGMRTIAIRPAFIYDSTRPISMPLAAATGVTSMVNGLFGGKLPLLGAAGYKPLKVEQVAGAAVEALGEEGVAGVVDVKGLEQLATRAWRKEMI